MGLLQFSKSELNKLCANCKDSTSYEAQKVINSQILNIIEQFCSQGHTGTTASYTINILNKLLNYKPLSPLTGEDDEWVYLNYGDDLMYQNKRCPSVFKDSQGKAYYTEGKIFSDDNGHTWYTNSQSRIYITFPFEVPDKPECVIVDNKDKREEIFKELSDILNKLGTQTQNYTEDDYLENLIDEQYYCSLEEMIKKKYNLDKFITHIDNDTKLYQIVTGILYHKEG